MKKQTYFILLTVSILFNFSCYGQVNTAIQWQKVIGGSGREYISSINPTRDSGYIIGCTSNSDSSFNKSENSRGSFDYWIYKTDKNLNIQWQKTIGGTKDDGLGCIESTIDGGYILGGSSNSRISGDKIIDSISYQDLWIVKIDSIGNIQWQNGISISNINTIEAIYSTKDSGFIVLGDAYSVYSDSDFIYIFKLDKNGNIKWKKYFDGNGFDVVRSSIKTIDDGYLIGAYSNSSISGDKTEDNYGLSDIWLIKIDSIGNIIWQNTIGGTGSDYLYTMKETPDNGFILGATSNSNISFDKTENSQGFIDYWIIKIDSIGNIQWQNTIGGSSNDYLNSIINTSDNGFLVGGTSTSTISGDKIEDTIGGGFSRDRPDIWIVKLDSIGNILWQKNIGGKEYDEFVSVIQTSDNSFLLFSNSNSPVSGNKTVGSNSIDTWIINIVVNPKLITGNIFSDINNDCIQNANEKGLPNYSLKASNGLNSSYATSQTNGKYYIPVNDTGLYSIELLTNPTYLYFPTSNCNSYFIHLRDSIDTINFAMKPDKLCTLNTVNISVNGFRRCRQNTFYVSYCNNGTIASTNTYIDVKLDRLLVLNSASVSYSALPNNTYRFNIGTLDYLTCGNFSINATPICDSTITGQTLCTEAHIYPDTICTTPNYTGSYIVASAQCLGDSVELKLENRGGNMQQIKKYIVIEDQVMRINRNYQLPRNGTIIEKMPADSGHTYRIIAEQEDALPPSYGDKFATAAIEGCRPNPALNFSTGYFTQFPNYDGEPFRAVSCNVITGSYDPNDKFASPVGYATQHYIEKNTQIDYQINFQNTGNDTAFKVVVVDTISPTLDINSIQLGVASHAYQFQRTDSNVVQFVFDNILLVDSFRNEPKSHGFVKFKIQQKLNNANGTKIYNSAAIYFDYNAPIITNRTFHTVGQNFVTVQLINTIKNPKYNVKEVKVFPNPFREKTQIIVESNELKNPVLLLMNIQGQLIKTISSTYNNTFDIYREDLSNGMYLFKIMQDENIVANGKVVVQ